MLIVILLGLFVAVLAGSLLAGVAFYDVAFAGVKNSTPKPRCGCSGCGGCSRRDSEVQAITALVQKSLPRADIEKIRNWTKAHTRVKEGRAICPMMGDDGSCIVFSSQSTVDAVL